MKKKLCLILSLVMFICSTSSSLAFSGRYNFPEYIQDIIEERFENKVPIETKELLDCDGNSAGYLLLFAPTGYIIYEENELYEMSTTCSYNVDADENIYYFGPLNIYQKINSEYVHVVSSEKISDDAVFELDSIFKEKKRSNIVLNDTTVAADGARAVVSDYLPYVPRLYDYNPDDKCGSLAVAITLMYYDDYIDSYMVPDFIANADSNGQYFVGKLTPNIEGLNSSYSGSTTSDVQSGINWYFRYRGISDQYSVSATYSPTYSQYKSRINQDRPAIILINSHPIYGNHWVVGYGYYAQTSGTSTRELLIVNDGWGNAGREISHSYVISMVNIY